MSAIDRLRMSRPGRHETTALDGTGRELPAAVVRAGLGVLLLALALMHVHDAFGWIALVTGLGAVLSPWPALAWVAMASLALSELAEPGRPAAWHPYVMLAGLVLAHTLAARVAITPLNARVALRVFARPLVVAAAVAVPAEALLVLALWLRATPHATWVPAAVIGALALLALGGLLFVRLLRRG